MEVFLKHSKSKGKWTKVKNLNEAVIKVRQFIRKHNCGGIDIEPVWVGGEVRHNGKEIAFISYNGKVWDVQDKEIRDPWQLNFWKV